MYNIIYKVFRYNIFIDIQTVGNIQGLSSSIDLEIAPDRNNNYQSVVRIDAPSSHVRFKLEIPCAVLLEHYNTTTPHFVRYFMANLKQKTEHIAILILK